MKLESEGNGASAISRERLARREATRDAALQQALDVFRPGMPEYQAAYDGWLGTQP